MTPDEIKRLRWSLKKTQTEFGELIGYTQWAISNIESGKRPISPKLEFMLKALMKGKL